MEQFFGERRIALYPSGTAALSRAIVECAVKAGLNAPEVIIPAYGCPDLVAACLHASAFPRLVDIAKSGWAYNSEDLERNITRNTVAIIAVNLLGVGDGASDLQRICEIKQISLIQDSAQYLPRSAIKWPGDYVILSFGRGKPLNLLCGGAMIEPLRNGSNCPARSVRYAKQNRLFASRAAALAFNFLTHPIPYGILSRLPGTRFGKVIYAPLHEANPLPDRAWERVGTAFEAYQTQPTYRRDIWGSAIAEWATLGILELSSPGSTPSSEPLRLALLAPDRAARDGLVNRLSRLGASPMYATDLAKILGIPEIVRRQGPFPNATILANHLFTLPTHQLVTEDIVVSARRVVDAWRRSRGASTR